MASGLESPACHFASCAILDVILKTGEHEECVSLGAEDMGMACDKMCKVHSRRRLISLSAPRPGRASVRGGTLGLQRDETLSRDLHLPSPPTPCLTSRKGTLCLPRVY